MAWALARGEVWRQGAGLFAVLTALVFLPMALWFPADRGGLVVGGAVLTFCVGVLANTAVSWWRVGRLVRRDRVRFPVEEVVITLAPSGLRSRIGAREGETRWSEVLEVREFAHGLLIEMGAMNGVWCPARSLPEAPRALVERLERWRRSAPVYEATLPAGVEVLARWTSAVDDWVAVSIWYQQEQQPAARGLRWISLALGGVVLVLLLALEWLGAPLSVPWSLRLTLVALCLAPAVVERATVRLLLPWLLRAQVRRRPEMFPVGEWALGLDPRGLHVRSPGRTGHFPWSDLQDVVRIEGYVVVRLGETLVVVVPDAAVDEPDPLRERLLRQRPAASQAPVGNSANAFEPPGPSGR